MIVGLLAIAAVGLTLFSLQHMMQEKVIKISEMTEYRFLNPVPPLRDQSPGSIEVKGQDLSLLSSRSRYIKIENGKSLFSYPDISVTEHQFIYDSQWSGSRISSVNGGQGVFSYYFIPYRNDYRYSSDYLYLDVTVPQRVTIINERR